METIFKYENWPYFFIAILIFLIIINTSRCHESGKFLTLAAKEYHDKKVAIIPTKSINKVAEQTAAQVAAQISEQTAAQVAARIAGQTAEQAAVNVASQVAGQVAGKTAEQAAANVASQVASQVAGQVTGDIINETFATKVPKTFNERFSVKHVAQREKFQNIEPYNRSVKGVDIGALGCPCYDKEKCECADCYKNLNDQINLGVNNYMFPNCNNDFMCTNGCNIQDQINNYQFDYRMGQSSTELERSRSGMYTSLNVDSCSQECPSMGWMPEATTLRSAAADYINTLVPVADLKKK